MSPLLALLLALQLGDAITTIQGLRLPGVRENNRWLSILMNKIGVGPALLLTKAVVAVGLIAAQDYIGDEVLFALIVLYVVIVVNNMRVILKAEDARQDR